MTASTPRPPSLWEKIALAAIALVTTIIGGSRALSEAPSPGGVSEAQVRVIATEVSERVSEKAIQNYDATTSAKLNAITAGVAEVRALILKRNESDDSKALRWEDEQRLLRDRVKTLELTTKKK